jgi:hypothetical protein
MTLVHEWLNMVAGGSAEIELAGYDDAVITRIMRIMCFGFGTQIR